MYIKLVFSCFVCVDRKVLFAVGFTGKLINMVLSNVESKIRKLYSEITFLCCVLGVSGYVYQKIICISYIFYTRGVGL